MGHVAAAGWSRQRVAEFLHEKARLPVSEWMRWHRMGHELDHDRLVSGGSRSRPHHRPARRRDGRRLRQPHRHLGQQPVGDTAGGCTQLTPPRSRVTGGLSLDKEVIA